MVLPPKKNTLPETNISPKKRRFLLNSYWKPHHFQGRTVSLRECKQISKPGIPGMPPMPPMPGIPGKPPMPPIPVVNFRWLGGLVVSKHWKSAYHKIGVCPLQSNWRIINLYHPKKNGGMTIEITKMIFQMYFLLFKMRGGDFPASKL